VRQMLPHLPVQAAASLLAVLTPHKALRA